MTIPYDDRGLLLADGLFETLLAVDGRLVLFEAHAVRMQEGAAVLGLPAPSVSELRSVANTALADSGLQGRAAVRVTFTAGSGGRGLERPSPTTTRLFATAAPSPRSEHPLSLAVVEVRRNDRSPASRLKTLAYLDNVLARRQARALGAEEAVMLNTDGAIACAAAANLFWVAENRLFTPSLECGVLPGVMRAQVLARADDAGLRPAEVRAGVDALDNADAVFLTSSLLGVRPVARIGDRPCGPSGAVAKLAAAVADVS